MGSVEAEAEAEEDVSLVLWKADMAKMQLGTKMLFMNDFAGAESVFGNGMKQPPGGGGGAGGGGVGAAGSAGRSAVAGVAGVRNLRGAFALQYALVSVIKGVASLANDQLDECLQRLWFAEELAAQDSEWLGKSVVRGICTLMGGVVQVLQHSFVKGVFNVLKSWMWIKVLQSEAVEYEGKEREVVRSCALFTLGIFNVLLSLLPSSMTKAASFVSGFKGDRQAGLGMLVECWREDGMFAPWGALVWVAYNVDTKSFLDESLSPAEVATCVEIFGWARERYPNSVFFSGIEADFEACRKNVRLASEIIDRAAPFAGELKALEWALNYKRGVYELTELNFAEAAVYFETSLQVYERVQRRSMVPFMAMYAALCYHVVADEEARMEALEEERGGLDFDYDSDGDGDADAEDGDSEADVDNVTVTATATADGLGGGGGGGEGGEGEGGDALAKEEARLEGLRLGGRGLRRPVMDASTAAAHVEEMLALVAKYKGMAKDNWGRQDKWAFRIYKEYESPEALASLNGALDGDARHGPAGARTDNEASSSSLPLPPPPPPPSSASLSSSLSASLSTSTSESPAGEERREPWPLLDLAESMIWRMRCTRWMHDDATSALLEMLQRDAGQRAANPDDDVRVCACFAQVMLDLRNNEAAFEWCEKGLALEPALSKGGRAAAYGSMLLYLRALNMHQRGQVLAAKHSLALLEARPKSSSWIYHFIIFKAQILKTVLAGVSEDEAYSSRDIKAGEAEHEVVEVDEAGQVVAWDWACTKHDVGFSAVFRPADEEVPVEILSTIERLDEKDGPCVGYFVSPCVGTLIFEWDNRYSFMRSKRIVFRIAYIKAAADPTRSMYPDAYPPGTHDAPKEPQ